MIYMYVLYIFWNWAKHIINVSDCYADTNKMFSQPPFYDIYWLDLF